MFDLDHAFEMVGGFGRFQWLATIALTIARNGGNYMYYGFAYLTMEQMYTCQAAADKPYMTCSAEEDICPSLATDQPLSYRVDDSYLYYLNNWYVQMDLVCANKVQTNFMISAQYIAYGLAGIFLFAMPDRLGRKPTMVINYGMHLFAQYLILLDPSYTARLIGLIIYGLAQLKQSVVYVWMAELVPSTHTTPVTVSLTSFDAGSIGIICTYFLLISRDWFPLMLFMTALSTLAFIAIIFFLPESPSWLLSKGRIADAVQVFNYIGRVNGS